MKKIDILLWNFKELFVLSNYKRDKKTILFGAWFGNKFADNSRFLYQYLSKNKVQLGLNHIVWVTRNRAVYEELRDNGYEVYMMDTPESIQFHRKAGIHILCNGSNDDLRAPGADLLGRYSLGAVKINLWHGLCGIKGFGFSSNEYLNKKREKPIWAYFKELIHRNAFFRKAFACFGGWGDCYFLSTTKEITHFFMEATFFPEENFIETGYPRNYTTSFLLPRERCFVESIDKYNVKILYLPTFRDNACEFIPPLNDPVIIDWLKSHGAVWIEKGHDADKLNMLSVSNAMDNVVRLKSSFEISILMDKVDLLITDYSSAMYEALFVNIPVIYYVPDLEHYGSSDRGFMQSTDQFMVGPKAKNGMELEQLLNQFVIDKKSAFLPNYRDVKNKAWGECKNIEQIWNDICYRCFGKEML